MLLLLRAILLWSLVSLHIFGAAAAFRRYFPRESAWLGFILPAFAFTLLMNFIEHGIGFSTLFFLLPFTLAGSFWFLLRPGLDWKSLAMPGTVFLLSYAFTLFIRCLHPNVSPGSDGVADLSLVADYYQGETIPPHDIWLPPYRIEWYYTFPHYCASVLGRLLGVDVGTGYNLSHALVSAFICFCAAAAAWVISRGKVLVTLAMIVLVEACATGSSAYLWLTEPRLNGWVAYDLASPLRTDHNQSEDGVDTKNNPIWHLLSTQNFSQRLELEPGGWWTWRDEFHSNAAGHCLIFFSLWVLLELFRTERSNWPWITSILLPLLCPDNNIFALPIVGLLGAGGWAVAWLKGLRPENLTFVLYGIGVGFVLLWPSLYTILSVPEPPPMIMTTAEMRTPLWEFVIQWWPVLLLWISAALLWLRLSLPLRWVLLVIPISLALIECFNVETSRFNTIEKMWGYTFDLGLGAFFPFLAVRAHPVLRAIVGLVMLNSAVALTTDLNSNLKWLDPKEVLRLEADWYLKKDPQKARILQVLEGLGNARIITGKVVYAYYESAALGIFSHNYDYCAWPFHEWRFGHGIGDYGGEAYVREDEVNNFYDGKLPDPLLFLRERNITAVVIYPKDNISSDFITTLSRKLAPDYEYIDCKGEGTLNAGIFLYRPGMLHASPATSSPPPVEVKKT